ncbi:platelet glycoprotein Ib alpha chain [Pogoniulus pusillus]|uniref:platelet glycoprotein Ib alpha chain n=1 Tax=Pogoniulus pusillus TaxID=488313 RepID=UPI0030B9420E
MWVPVLLLLPALLPPASTSDPDQPCPSELNKVKDLLEVNCTEQSLSKVPAGLPEDAGILLLSTNRFTSLSTAEFLRLTQLQHLDLSHNALVVLHTGPLLLALRELILSHNELWELPTLQGLPALTHLALAHNRLATLAPGAFRAVPRLQDLDLRGNQLQTLPQKAFEGLRALRDLDLSDNLLAELPAELLQDLQRLEILWLSGNRLRSLPSGFFPEGHIFMYVFLTENPWHCDCHLRYLRLWIRHNEDSVYQPERGLEKTKVEVAPEKVLCHSPPELQRKPIIYFRPDCGTEGDADEEEEDDYGDGEEPTEIATRSTLPLPQPSPEESTAALRSSHPPLLTATAPPPSAPPSSTPAPSTLPTALASTTAPSPTPAPSTAPPSTAPPSTAPPSTAPPSTAPTAPPPHSPSTLPSTTLPSSTSLPTTTATAPPSTSSSPQTTLATSTTNTFTTPRVTTGTAATTPTAVPSPAVPEASSPVRAPSPPLTPTTLLGSSTLLSTHAPSPPATLGTTHFTHPAPSPSPAPVPLCPCSIQGPAVHMLHSQAGAGGPQWGQWVLRHCCLLHWGLYLTSLILLVLMMLALAGCLAWLCLVGRTSWHKSWQTQEVQYPLLERREATESSAAHLSSSKSHSQHRTFCTIREVELWPEVTYCTFKDLSFQRHPPAPASFRTTKQLWVRRSPPEASFQCFSEEPTVAAASCPRAPSAYSLDRGVRAMGRVTVKYAGNTW